MSKPNNGKPAIFFSKTIGTIKTPAGTALFAHLIEPDSFRGGEPNWKISLVFDPADPEFTTFKAQIWQFAKEFSADCGKSINTDKVFSADKNTGNPMMTFKSKVRLDETGNPIRLPLVDAQKKPLDKEPWSGDVCRVAVQLGGWESAMGQGIKPYLSAVQLVERKPRTSTFKSTNVFDSAPNTTTDEECPF